MPLIFFLYEKKNVILSNSLYTNNKQNQHNQKYHFGLTSTSFSVNSWYWYHSPPPFPTGIRTRMDNFNCLAISSKFEPEVLSDLPIGSTGIHLRLEMLRYGITHISQWYMTKLFAFDIYFISVFHSMGHLMYRAQSHHEP